MKKTTITCDVCKTETVKHGFHPEVEQKLVFLAKESVRRFGKLGTAPMQKDSTFSAVLVESSSGEIRPVEEIDLCGKCHDRLSKEPSLSKMVKEDRVYA